MRPAMYIILNQNAGMSTGKAAAQASHAAVEAYRLSLGATPHIPCVQHDEEPNIVRRWYRGGHYTKIVLGAENMDFVRGYIEARGFKCALIVDEGRTEIAPFTPTAVGVEIVDKDDPHVQDTFGEFKLYNDPRPTGYIEISDAPTLTSAKFWQRLLRS